MNKKHSFKWYFLRWAVHWFCFIDNFIGILSLGFWTPSLSLKGMTLFLDYEDYQNDYKQ